jgi:hypothetical protein
MLPAALAMGGLVLALCGCGLSERPPLSAELSVAARHSRIHEEQPPHPEPPYDIATRTQERARQAAPPPRPRPHAKRKPKLPKVEPEPELPPAAVASPSTPLPPASKGNNGSYVPPASNKRIDPGNVETLERREEKGLAISFNGIALASPSAPKRIKEAISAANELVGLPYIWGGGHASWYANGYDCSGAVSYALAGGGFLSAPLTSVGLESWGAPGPGRWLTVYANAVHTFTVIDGLRFDTVGDARGSGPRWHPLLADTQGFVARHPPGY